MSTIPQLPAYALANNLRGFGPNHTTLRVRVTEVRDGCAWVVTADLADAGTQLVLDESKIEFEKLSEVVMHKDGLVAFV